MMTIKQAFNIFKVTFKDTFQKSLKNLGKKSEDKNIGLKKKNDSVKKVFLGIFIAIGLIMIVFYVAAFSAMMTNASIASNLRSEILYTFIGLSQLVVIFFGSAVLLNYLYFSKDNQLLSSLPVSSKSIFISKYAMAYISELFMCLLLYLPMLITYGVVSSSMGIHVGASFYIITALSSLLLPIFPLLIASIVSIPLMYIVSFLKKRALGNAIVVGVITLGVISLYFMFIGSVSGMSQNTGNDGNLMLTAGMIKLITNVKKITIFNYNLVNALLNNKGALNFLLYLAELIAMFAATILISSAFYGKGMRIIIEGSGNFVKKTAITSKNYVSKGFMKSYIAKEIKNILNTPSLFVGTILGIVIIPVFTYIFGSTFVFSEEGITSIGSELGMIGMIMYMSAIMMASGNTVAIVGISMEGKNMYLLKSLPIKVNDILKPKLIVSNSINVIIALITALSILFISKYHNVLIALLVFITLIINGIGTCSNGLYNDLKNPNLHYKNVTELTKNNKRIIKPVLINIGIGLSYMIMGIVLSLVPLRDITRYALFFGIILLVNGLYAALTWKHLIDNAEEKYENIEV